MGYYLFDHPPRRSQGAPRTTWGFPSRPSGVVAVHDTEGVMDDQGDDWGAENTAAYITTRDDPGSYHEIHDGDSVVVMAPDDWMTWNVAADSANGHNWGISAACRTADWNPDALWTQRVIASMGRGIVAFWTRNGIDIAKANRWITRDEANRRIPGLILHGTWQPDDRSDAWATHPQRARLDQMLVDAIAAAANLVPGAASPADPPPPTPPPVKPPTRKGPPMSVAFNIGDHPAVPPEQLFYIEQDGTPHHLPGPARLALYVNTGVVDRADPPNTNADGLGKDHVTLTRADHLEAIDDFLANFLPRVDFDADLKGGA